MHVLHIVKEPSIGGVPIFVNNLIAVNNKQSLFQSVLFVRKSNVVVDGYQDDNSNKYELNLSIPIFRPYRIFKKIRPILLQGKKHRVYRLFRKVRPDLIHCHLSQVDEVTVVMDVCTRLRLPFIWTIHVDLMPNYNLTRDLLIAIKNAERNDIPLVITYVGKKPPLLDLLENFQNITIKHVPSGIILEDYQDEQNLRSNKRQQFGFSEQDYLIGFVGRLCIDKGVDLLLQAANHLMNEYPKVRLIIIGEGQIKNELLDYVQNEFKNRVIFSGLRTDVNELLPMLDLYIQPSRHEGLPLSMLEAAASGIPIIASDVGAISEFICDGRTGLLIQPESISGIVNAIKKFIHSPAFAKQCSESALRAVKDYDMEKICLIYNNIYLSML